uniref:Uncharacterized protein n=1 Tax=Anguilla anguilla TaxID=7936 RepID=A0A0E9WBK5_ANGAN
MRSEFGGSRLPGLRRVADELPPGEGVRVPQREDGPQGDAGENGRVCGQRSSFSQSQHLQCD